MRKGKDNTPSKRSGAHPASEASDVTPEEEDSDLGEQDDDADNREGAQSSDETDVTSNDSSSDNEELDRALLDVVASRDSDAHTSSEEGAHLNERQPSSVPPTSTAGQREDPASDSSEDDRKPRNAIGSVPLRWYKDENHIGYDRRGQKLQKRKEKDKLEALLAKNDLAHQWRTIYDEYNDEEITLNREEIELLQRIRQGRFPHVEVNPYEPEADWFSREQEIHPLSNAPEPKRRFMASKWEEKRVVKLVRALRKGWIKRESEDPKEPEIYLMWADDGNVAGWTASGLQYLPPTKPKLPGHAESYNPPKEYLPSEEEKNAYALLDDEEKPEYIPRQFTSLRKVPAYEEFIKERFERCLDLYLCPRKARKRPYVKDPQTLVPQLPKPQDLQPFPTTLLLQFRGHKAAVLSISLDSQGQWLASGSSDGTVKVWESATGRCIKTWDLATPVSRVAWCPNADLCLLAAATQNRLLLINASTGTEEAEAATAQALQPPEEQGEKASCKWQSAQDVKGALELKHSFALSHVCWHGRGDYFATVAPTGNTQAVLVHQLSKKNTQNPFKRSRGRVIRVSFHPAKPFFFVATLNHIFVYNLAKQELVKKLQAGSSSTADIAVHPSGDHVIVGKQDGPVTILGGYSLQDNRLLWFDLDLSTKPYKSMKYHEKPLEAVAFHRRYPLFASASADGSVHIFHGMVYSDYLTNPLIVPVKILRGHKISDRQGVLDCAFHPQQPWIFSAGADSNILLFTN